MKNLICIVSFFLMAAGFVAFFVTTYIALIVGYFDNRASVGFGFPLCVFALIALIAAIGFVLTIDK